jgi:hypothetical protein
MNRRKFLATLGTAAAGTSAAVGTGAFTGVSADRSVSVEVADDADALLTMEPSSGPNGEYAETTGDGTIALAFTDTDAGGTGLGTDSTYQFDDVFRITNQGTQPVYVWATFSGASGSFTPDGSDTDVHLYPNGDSDDRLRDSDDDVLYLGVGQSAGIGVYIDTTGVTADQELTMTVNADAENPASGAVVGGGGTTISGPANGLVGYWPLDDLSGGTAPDIVGTNPATQQGSVTEAGGLLNGAASLDGSDDYFELGDVLGLTESFSLSALVNASESQVGFTRLISRELSGRGNRQYNLIFDRSGTAARSAIDLTDGSTAIVEGNESVTDGEWHLLTATFDSASDLRLYVDGTRVDSVSTGASAVSRSTGVYLGTIAHTPGTRLYEGLLDDVRIYNRALSENEVDTLHQQTRGGGGS